MLGGGGGGLRGINGNGKYNKNWAIKKHRNRLTDAENRLIVVRGEGFGGIGEKSEGHKKYKLVFTK